MIMKKNEVKTNTQSLCVGKIQAILKLKLIIGSCQSLENCFIFPFVDAVC